MYTTLTRFFIFVLSFILFSSTGFAQTVPDIGPGGCVDAPGMPCGDGDAGDGATKDEDTKDEDTKDEDTEAEPQKPQVRYVRFRDLKAGEVVTSGKNTVTIIRFDDGSKVLLNEGASFRVVSISEQEESKTVLHALKGKFRYIIQSLKAGELRIQVQIGNQKFILSIRGTEFLLEVIEDEKATLQVLEGLIEASDVARKTTTEIEAGSSITITEEGISKPKTFDPKTLDLWYEGIPLEQIQTVQILLGVLGGAALLAAVFVIYRKRPTGPSTANPLS